MYAYIVKASYPPYGKDLLASLFVSIKGKKEVSLEVAAAGWSVKSVSLASAHEIDGLPTFAELVVSVNKEIQIRKLRDAEAKREEYAARVAAAAREAERLREEREQMNREAQAAQWERESSLRENFGDILASPPEESAFRSETFGVLRQKIALLLKTEGINIDSVYTNICLDFASFQGLNAARYPRACRLLSLLVESMGRWIQLDRRRQGIIDEFQSHAANVNDNIRSIASRSYIYGGSGLGLLLSAWDADSNVKRDESQIRSLQAGYRSAESQTLSTLEEIKSQGRFELMRITAIYEMLEKGRLDIPRLGELVD